MSNSTDISVIGVDLGGTKILAGKVQEGKILDSYKMPTPNQGSEQEVLQTAFKTIDKVFDEDINGIGIGVPSIVDVEKGIVYDVQNIPSWKEVHLKSQLEKRYKVPVYIDNDANCFAAGENYYGKGKAHENFIALIVGTGMAGGIIIQNKLYRGFNCGAGEFGMLPYLDKIYEYYCAGQFFNNVHKIDGAQVFQKAEAGDEKAILMFEELGQHLGNAIKSILYTYDPELIVLGGSVSKAYHLYEKILWENIRTFAYAPVPDRLKIEISEDPDIAVLGAAALYFDASGI